MSSKLPFFDSRRKNNKSLHTTINKLMKKRGTKKNVMSFGNIKSRFARYKKKQTMKKLKSRQSKKLKLQSKYRRRNNKSTRKLFNSMKKSKKKMYLSKARANYASYRKKKIEREKANKQWRRKHAKKLKTMKKYGRHSEGSVKSWSAYRKKYGNTSGRTKKKKRKKR